MKTEGRADRLLPISHCTFPPVSPPTQPTGCSDSTARPAVLQHTVKGRLTRGPKQSLLKECHVVRAARLESRCRCVMVPSASRVQQYFSVTRPSSHVFTLPREQCKRYQHVHNIPQRPVEQTCNVLQLLPQCLQCTTTATTAYQV